MTGASYKFLIFLTASPTGTTEVAMRRPKTAIKPDGYSSWHLLTVSVLVTAAAGGGAATTVSDLTYLNSVSGCSKS